MRCVATLCLLNRTLRAVSVRSLLFLGLTVLRLVRALSVSWVQILSYLNTLSREYEQVCTIIFAKFVETEIRNSPPQASRVRTIARLHSVDTEAAQ